MTDSTKPDYRVPTMSEVRIFPKNGMRVASLFAGAGGSCLGYRMAGFQVAWANEFVAAARATYTSNFPDTVIDARDIREVKGQDIVDAVGMVDVLDGSPPCSAHSDLVRKNTRKEDQWARENKYSDTKQRTDDLFGEYARVVGELKPRAFVAENVAGFVKGTSKGIFLNALQALKGHGYRVSARMLDAQWLGVPQSRARLVIVGFREDLEIDPVHPTPLSYRHTLRDALEGLPRDEELEAKCSFVGYAIEDVWRKLYPGQHREDKYFGLYRCAWDRPANAVTATSGKIGGASLSHPDEPRKFTVPELRRICGFPDDFVLAGDYFAQVERMGRAVPPPMMARVARCVAERLAASSGR